MKIFVINAAPFSKNYYRSILYPDGRFEYVPHPASRLYKDQRVRYPSSECKAFPSYLDYTSFYSQKPFLAKTLPFLSKETLSHPVFENPFLTKNAFLYAQDPSYLRSTGLSVQAKPGDMLLFYTSLFKHNKSRYLTMEHAFIGYLIIKQMITFGVSDRHIQDQMLKETPEYIQAGVFHEWLLLQQNKELYDRQTQTWQENHKALSYAEPTYILYTGTDQSRRLEYRMPLTPETVSFMYQGGIYNSKRGYYEKNGIPVVNRSGKVSFFKHFHARVYAAQHYLDIQSPDSEDFTIMHDFWQQVQHVDSQVPSLKSLL